jgi:hypothetical protein
MTLSEEAIAKAKENPEEYELALRPEPDSIACTNCLLARLLSFLHEQEGDYETIIEISKEDVKALKRHFKNAK